MPMRIIRASMASGQRTVKSLHCPLPTAHCHGPIYANHLDISFGGNLALWATCRAPTRRRRAPPAGPDACFVVTDPILDKVGALRPSRLP